MVERFIKRLKQMPQGSLRLLILISILIPVVSLLVWFNVNGWAKYKRIESISLFLFFFGYFIFWGIAGLIIWIKDGYRGDNTDKD